jgi:hypothetical protein
METTIEMLHQEIKGLRNDLLFIKDILIEKNELSDYAKNSLMEARETPDEDYVELK